MAYCWRCNNTGWIDCRCGGDLCICENGGEVECPRCDGFPDHDDGHDDDDLDVDVCLNCGRYYGMSPELKTAWQSRPDYREGEVMPQRCLKCMRGDPS